LTTTFRTSIAALCLVALAACDGAAPKFRSTDISGVDYGKSLELTDHHGKLRRLEDFRGKAVVVFFGFTHCPDVCPTTLADMAIAMKQLGPDADRVQVLMVTVDPERDTQDALAKYVPAFDARFLGLRGDLDATRRTAKEFKVYFEKRAGKTPDGYSIDHSAQSYVIDTQGRLRLFVRHDRITEDLAPDLRTLLKAAG
jgi:protein SCO1